MALAATHLVGGLTNGGTGSKSMGSITPDPYSLLVVCVSLMGDGTYVPKYSPTANTTVTGGGLTWTVREYWDASGSWNYSCAIYTAQCGASPGTFNPTIDGNNGGSPNWIGWVGWSITEVTGHNPAAPYVEGIASHPNLDTFDLTLPVAPRTTDLVIAMCGADLADAGTPNVDAVDWGAGMTEVYDGVSNGTADFGSHSVAIRTGSTSTTVPISNVGVISSSVYSSGGAAIILQAPVLVTDDFNRADAGTLGSNWAANFQPAWIGSNKAVPLDTTDDYGGYWTADTFPADQFVEADVDLTSTTGYTGVVLWARRTAANASYAVEWHNGDGGVIIVKNTNGWTTIGTSVNNQGMTGKLRVEVVGTSIKVYRDGVEKIATTDSTHTSGQPGFHLFYQNTVKPTLDNFRAGSLPRTDPPTLVAYSESNPATTYAGGATITAGSSFSWVAGDVVIVAVGNENTWQTTAVVNKTNLTFVAVSAAVGQGGSECYARMYYAIATGSGSGAMTATASGTGPYAHIVQAWHYRDSDGIGNTAAAAITANTRTRTMTAQAQSAVVTAWYDYNAINENWTGEANTGTLTERSNFYASTRWSGWSGDWSGVAAGSDGWGVQTGGSVLDISFAGTVEVLGKTTEGLEVKSTTGTSSLVLSGSGTVVKTQVPIVVTDDFNRADGALGANWTAIGTAPVIASNKVQATGVSASCRAAWTTAIGNGATSIFVEADITPEWNTSYSGVLLTEANNSYDESYGVVLSGDGTEVYLTRRTGGVDLDIATCTNLSLTLGAPHKVRLEWLVGGTVKVYVDGVEVIWTSGSGTNTDVTPSYAGIQFYTGSGTLDVGDNFRAGEVSVVNFAASASNTSAKSFTGLSWGAGDVVVVSATASNDTGSINTPTNANLTFALQASAASTTGDIESMTYIWAATAASAQSAQTISVPVTVGTSWLSIAAVHVVRGMTLTGSTAQANYTEAPFSRNVPAGATVIYVCGDWNDTIGANHTLLAGSGVGTERVDGSAAADGYDYFFADWQNTAAGTFDFGYSDYVSPQRIAHAVLVLPPAAASSSAKSTVGAGSLAFAASGTAAAKHVVTGTSGLVLDASGVAAKNVAPGTITDLAAAAGDTQVVLTWTAPSDGGDAITDYVVEYRVAP